MPQSPNSQPLADLHTHTHYSDGTDSPRRVIEMAKQAGLAAIAITDHDILDGHPEAEAAAREHGVELIPGIEMSAAHAGIEVHVLGFFIESTCQPLQQLLAEQRDRRVRRMHEMVRKLQSLGYLLGCRTTGGDLGRETVQVKGPWSRRGTGGECDEKEDGGRWMGVRSARKRS